MTDAFALYKRLLAGEVIEPTSDFDPSAEMAGYWRAVGARTKPDYPLMIWPSTEDPSVFTFQFWKWRPKNSVDNAEEWHRLVTEGFFKLRPVTLEVFNQALEGDYWPDGKPCRVLTEAEKLDLIPDTPADEGGNMPEGEDAFYEQIKAKLESATEKGKALGNIDTQEKANELASVIDTLSGLGKQGEAQRKADKQPWLDGAAAVDGKWKPVLEPASSFIAHCKTLIERFKRAEQAKRDEERRKAEAAERERIRQETEKRLAEEAAARAAEQAAQGEEADVPSDDDIKAEAARQAAEAPVEIAPAAKVEVRSDYGRAVSVAKKKRAVIEDQAKLIMFFVDGDDQDFLDYLQKRADAAARSKTALPGCRVVEE